MKNSIIDLWSKIEAFTSVEPNGSRLNKPISSEEILQFKEEINMELPQEFLARAIGCAERWRSASISNDTLPCVSASYGPESTVAGQVGRLFHLLRNF